MLRHFFSVALLLPVLIPFGTREGLSQTQTPSPAPKAEFTSYAAEDFKAYKQSSYTNAAWDPLVKEGFEAFDREDMTTAIEFLRKSSNVGCKSPLVFFKLALGYESQGSYYSAVQYYELAAEGFKSAHPSHRYWKNFDENYGRALYLLGQKEKAIPILEKAAKNSNNPWILKLLAGHYMEKKDLTQACAYYERLLSLPDHGLSAEEEIAVTTDLARVATNQNDVRTAEKYYRRVLELDPANAEARKYLHGQETERSLEKVIDVMESR